MDKVPSLIINVQSLSMSLILSHFHDVMCLSQIHTGLQHEIIWAQQANGLPLELPTMADKLREAGYSTHAVGKWHLGFYKKEYTPKYRGFDSYYGKLIFFFKTFYRSTLDYSI